MNLYVRLVFLAAACAVAPCVGAQSVGEATVSLVCRGPQGETVRGTGVLVSAQGHVLTAKHIAPEGYVCEGPTGPSKLPRRVLIRIPVQANVDAILLRIPLRKDERVKWLKWCRLDETLQGRAVVASGFPEESTTGELSTHPGDLPEVISNTRGIVESATLAATKMGGAPVTVQGGSTLLGILGGADFDVAGGLPSRYGVVTAESFAANFGDVLTQASTCEPRNTGGQVDAFVEQEHVISRLAAFGRDSAHVRNVIREITTVVGDPEVSRANEFAIETRTSYFEVGYNPPRTNRRGSPDCAQNGRVVFFFRNGALFRVSLRSWYSAKCTEYDGYFAYASEGVQAEIAEQRFGDTAICLAQAFLERDRRMVMSGWRDQRVAIIDIAESGKDDFMGDDWLSFVSVRLKHPD